MPRGRFGSMRIVLGPQTGGPRLRGLAATGIRPQDTVPAAGCKVRLKVGRPGPGGGQDCPTSFTGIGQDREATGPQASRPHGRRQPAMRDGPGRWPSRSLPIRNAPRSSSSDPAWISCPCSPRRSRLPPPRRWDVEFSTYFTQTPRGIAYTWRGVLEGSPEAASARRLPGTLVIDLGTGLVRAPDGPLVLAARTGQSQASTESDAIGTEPPPPPTAPSRGMPRPAGPPGPILGPPGRQSAATGRTPELIPERVVRLAGNSLSHGG